MWVDFLYALQYNYSLFPNSHFLSLGIAQVLSSFSLTDVKSKSSVERDAKEDVIDSNKTVFW